MKQQTTRAAVVSAVVSAAAALTAPALAQATVYTGSVAPTHTTPVAATNVRSSKVTIDNEAGTWETVMSFRGSPTKKTMARTYLGFAVATATPRGDDQGGFVEVTTRGSRTTGVLRDIGGVAITDQPDPIVQVRRSGRTLTVEITDSRLVGLEPTTFYASRISWKNRLQDQVPAFALAAQTPEPTSPADR